MGRIAPRFGRVEPRRHARALVWGLCSDLPRKNCWTIAEYAGARGPWGLQHVLSGAVWDAEAVRDDLRDYVVEHLGEADANDAPDVVLVVDETGDLKKGTCTVAVARQYTGTAGRVENAQVGVYLVYASGRGHAFIDRALYLPRAWATDPDRRGAAGVPEQVGFATKPALATEMIARALDAGIAAGWVTGDEVYGADPRLRATCEHRQIGYVLAIGCDRRVATHAGLIRADQVAAELPAAAWGRYSAGKGAKGQRYYEWAQISIDVERADMGVGHAAGTGWCSLLIRRNRRTGQLAFYRTYSPHRVALSTLIRVAARRWAVEESFQTGKGLTGLDQHQVRTWTSWQRWSVLAMLAHAFLSVLAADEANTPPAPGQIPLTRNEIHHLINTLTARRLHQPEHHWHWSRWRRHHQHTSRTCHYQRQGKLRT